MEPATMSLHKRLRSFGYAFQGLATLLRDQPNARLHLGATVLVIVAGAYFSLNRMEWALLALCIVAVIAAEALNSAVEYLCDLVSPEFHPLVKKAKDVAAAAVLLVALGAAVVGALVFWPHVF
jgi:diacylglycerol kinase